MTGRKHEATVLGLTGGIGAGKSTITAYLQSQDIPVFDCDVCVAKLYQAPDVVAKLEHKYGPMGSDPKATMARKITAKPAILDELQKMFGIYIRWSISSFKLQHSDKPLIVIDAPILFEHGLADWCDATVTVSVPEDIRRARVMSRPGMTEEKLNVILGRQLTDAEREARATYSIQNTGTPEEAQEAMAAIMVKVLLKRLDDKHAS
jgi:dephospho-CoA kinase